VAHVAGLFTPVVGDPSAEDLWRRLKKELGVPCEERSNDHVRVATYRSHAEEAVLAPPGEVHAGASSWGSAVMHRRAPANRWCHHGSPVLLILYRAHSRLLLIAMGSRIYTCDTWVP